MLKEVSVTYHAPKGDSKVCTLFGNTFYDGKPETIIVDERTLAKIKGNACFESGDIKDHKAESHEPKTKAR